MRACVRACVRVLLPRNMFVACCPSAFRQSQRVLLPKRVSSRLNNLPPPLPFPHPFAVFPFSIRSNTHRVYLRVRPLCLHKSPTEPHPYTHATHAQTWQPTGFVFHLSNILLVCSIIYHLRGKHFKGKRTRAHTHLHIIPRQGWQGIVRTHTSCNSITSTCLFALCIFTPLLPLLLSKYIPTNATPYGSGLLALPYYGFGHTRSRLFVSLICHHESNIAVTVVLPHPSPLPPPSLKVIRKSCQQHNKNAVCGINRICITFISCWGC